MGPSRCIVLCASACEKHIRQDRERYVSVRISFSNIQVYDFTLVGFTELTNEFDFSGVPRTVFGAL